MNADIFYPIFTITVTNLVCFIRKKKQSCSGVLHPLLHQVSALGLQEAYSSRETPSCNRSWFELHLNFKMMLMFPNLNPLCASVALI